jgi:HEAT repeat protein
MRMLIFFASLAALALVVPFRASAEEAYRELPLSYWRQKLRDPQLKERRSAAASFAMMDSAMAKEGLADLIAALGDEDAQVKYFCAETLGKIGPDARPALPELVKLAGSEKNLFLTSAAGVAIASIDPESPDISKVVGILVRHEQALGKSATRVPSLAGAFLSKFPELTIRHTVPLLESDDRLLRCNAARVLAAAGPPARELGEKALLKALHDDESSVRVAAVDALYRVSPAEIRTALPVVVGLLGSRQFRAFHAAEIFKPHAGEFCPRLIRELEGKSNEEQSELVSALFLMRATSLPLVIAAFNDPSAAVRRGAAAVTGAIGQEAAASIPGLLKLAKDPDSSVRLGAVEALERVDQQKKHLSKWLPVVEALVRNADAPEQGPAVELLRRLGPVASGAAPVLFDAMNATASPRRVAMALALVQIDPGKGREALPVLLEALDDPNRPRETEVVQTVGNLGTLARPALPALRQKLAEYSGNFSPRLNVARAMVKIDRDEVAGCLPVVLEMLQQEPGRSLRKADAILAMIEWDAAAQPAVPVLRNIVSEWRRTIRMDAAVSVGAKISMRNVAASAVGLALIDPDDVDGLQFIRRVVVTPEESDGRWQLLYILGRIGPAAKPLAKEIRPLLADPDFADQTRDVLLKLVRQQASQ